MRKKDLEFEIEELKRENERLKNTSKIPELEERLKNMAVKFWCEKSKNDDGIKIIQSLNKTIENLKSDNVVVAKQLAIAEKALELACGHISCLDVDGFKCNGEKNCIDCQNKFHSEKHLSNYFKTKAKEMLENEKIGRIAKH